MAMTWGEFKSGVEELGLTDDAQLWFVNFSTEAGALRILPNDTLGAGIMNAAENETPAVETPVAAPVPRPRGRG